MNTIPLVLVTHDDRLFQTWQQAAPPHPVRRAGLDWLAEVGTCVLIDAAMPGLPVWHDAWWQEKTARYRIIYSNTVLDDAEAYEALQAGCAGYCHAASPPEMLHQILEVISHGGLWVGPGLLQRMLTTINQLPSAEPETGVLACLSEREQEVARLAAKGEANKVIARELGITERTVKAHVSSALEKLHVKDRIQLALLINGIK